MTCSSAALWALIVSRCELQQRHSTNVALRIVTASCRAAPEMNSTSAATSSTIVAKHCNAIATLEQQGHCLRRSVASVNATIAIATTDFRRTLVRFSFDVHPSVRRSSVRLASCALRPAILRPASYCLASCTLRRTPYVLCPDVPPSYAMPSYILPFYVLPFRPTFI